jgi:xanthine dehydrogenase molybdenum-binding subunit
MLHGKLVRSPYAHAKVKSIDTSEAEKLPGVVAVITFKDTPATKYNPWLDSPHWVEPRDHRVLTDEPLYDGDAVAAVAAVDEETALEALDRIRVEWEVLPAVFDVFAAMKPAAPQLHEGYKNNIIKEVVEPGWVKGDVDRAFAEAAYIVEGEFDTQNIQHAPMERHCCVADYDHVRKALTVYAGTQNPFPLMTRIKYVFGLEDVPVRVITRPLGGSFGGNHHLFQHDGCAIALSMKTKRPVRCALTRAEAFRVNKRYGSHLYCKMACSEDGRLTAIDARWIANAGAYAVSTVANMSFPLSQILTTYRFENTRMKAIGVYTNTNPNTPFRGFGSPQAFFGFETLIDELAEKVGMDPVAFREANITRVGDTAVASQTSITSSGMAECLRIGRERIEWERKKEERSVSGSKKRGVGVACMSHCSGCTKFSEGWNESSSATVYINSDGYVTLVTGACETGQGIYTILRQIVAEAMGVPVETVRLQAQYADTASQPWDWGAFGSRSCYIAGSAALGAALEAKKALLEYATEMMEVGSAAELEIHDGIVQVKGFPAERKTFKEVAHHATELSKRAGQVMGHFTFHPEDNPPPFGAQFVEVEVDTETGKVDLLKFVAVHDVGRAINPQIVEGQIEGAAVQGIGFAMMEELKWDAEGKLRTDNYLDYVVPRSSDTPAVLDAVFVEPDDPTGPFGAKGVGEPGMVPTAAAISNAVYDATGVRMRALPLSPERVLRALQEDASKKSAGLLGV